ncbi:MAG: helix-turn-helix transcriptional regulator [Sphingobium sp.]|jgi:DNA-binding XRE family transcriptional regulator|nr:helix-turn-helix transcriptional regulator [Sphingobium sp.]MCP5400151.1 helix-turn-helix transcriptional regulator [Sphingomonas sp.]
MTVQIVEIAGQKMAMLPVADYQKLLDAAEDKADILAAMIAEQRRAEGEEYLPAEMLDRIMDGESALRLWRKYRGMTMDQLGPLCGVSPAFLSMLERGKRDASQKTWRALANALNVSIDDLFPFE